MRGDLKKALEDIEKYNSKEGVELRTEKRRFSTFSP
jgi:hypothetical protein